MDYRLYFKSRQGEMVGLLKELVQLESPTSDKKAVDACRHRAGTASARWGPRSSACPQKSCGDFHLFECPGREDRRRRPVLVLTHVDTVWPVGRLAKMPFYLSGRQALRPRRPGYEGRNRAGLSRAQGHERPEHQAAAADSVFSQLRRGDGLARGARHDRLPGQGRGPRRSLPRAGPARRSAQGPAQRPPRRPPRRDRQGRSRRPARKRDQRHRGAHPPAPQAPGPQIQGHLLNIGRCGGGEKANIVPDKAWALLRLPLLGHAAKGKDPGLDQDPDPGPPRGQDQGLVVESYTPPLEKTPGFGRPVQRGQGDRRGAGSRPGRGPDGRGIRRIDRLRAGAAVLDGLGPDGDGMHAEHEHRLLTSLIDRAALLTES